MSRGPVRALVVVAIVLVGGAIVWVLTRTKESVVDPGLAGARSDAPRSGAPVLEGDARPAAVREPTRSPDGALAVEGVLRRDGGRSPASGWRVRAVPLEGDGPASAWVSTDKEGRYRIEGLTERPHRLVALLGPLAEEKEVAARVVPTSGPSGAGPLVSSVEVAGGFMKPPPKPTDPGERGRVRIVGHDGGAVDKAHVAMSVPAPYSRGPQFGGFLDVVGGEFVRPPLEPWDATYEVSAATDAKGRPLPYGPVSQRFADAGEGPATVRMPPERVVEGRLLDPEGNGVPDRELHAVEEASLQLPPYAKARTGARGEFRLGGLGERRYLLRVVPAPGTPDTPVGWLASGDWSVVPSAEGVTGIELRFREGVSATVRVLDPTNAPVAEASVGAAKRGATPQPYDLRQSLTDAEGRVRLQALDPDAEYVLSVRPPRGRGDLRVHRQEGWKPGDVSIVLERGHVVSGSVRGEGGEPARGFVRQKQADGTFRPVAATGLDGAFTIPGLPDGPVTLAASATGIPTAATGPEVTVDAGTTGVVLSLPPASR